MLATKQNQLPEVLKTSMKSDFFGSEPFDITASNEWYLPPQGDETRKAIKADFFDSQTDDPEITYPLLDEIDFRDLEHRYWSILLDADTSNDELLYEQVALKLAELYRHKEILRQIGQHSCYDAEGYRRATEMSAEIFGSIDKHDFAKVLAKLRSRAIKSSLPEAKQLLDLVAVATDLPDSSAEFGFEMSKEDIEVLRADLFELFPNLESALEVEEEKEEYGPEDFVAQANKVIAVVSDMKESGWRAVIVDGNAASTSKSEKLIKIGRNRKPFKGINNLNEVIIHEVIGHGLRSHNAQKSDDERLHHNLPGNTDFEEGFATALQSLITGEVKVPGQQYLLALGLGTGMDRGGNYRSFREMFNILTINNMITAEEAGKEPNKIDAMNAAFQTCLRTRRGGTPDMRDIAYFNGAKKAHKLLSKIAKLPKSERIKKLELLFAGSYDATNQEQRRLFQKKVE